MCISSYSLVSLSSIYMFLHHVKYQNKNKNINFLKNCVANITKKFSSDILTRLALLKLILFNLPIYYLSQLHLILYGKKEQIYMKS